MASLGQTFRNEDAPERDNDLIPARTTVLAQVIESEIADTKKHDGKLLKLTFEVLTGPYERRRVWEQLNIVNPSAVAQGIAQRALAQLCEAIGLPGVSDSDELHHRPVMLTLGINPEKDGFPARNKVTKYSPAGNGGGRNPPAPRSAAASAGPAPAAAAPPPQQRAPAGAARPWN